MEDVLFVEHDHVERTDLAHCDGCFDFDREAEGERATEATDRPHCDGCLD